MKTFKQFYGRSGGSDRVMGGRIRQKDKENKN